MCSSTEDIFLLSSVKKLVIIGDNDKSLVSLSIFTLFLKNWLLKQK